MQEQVTIDELRVHVEGMDPGADEWAEVQFILATELHERYQMRDDAGDLNEAIERARAVVAALGYASPAHLIDLGLMLWDRIATKVTDEDLDEYIALNERATAVIQAGGEDMRELLAQCQANLAAGLMTRRRLESADDDRSRAILLWEEALASGLLETDEEAGIRACLAQALSEYGSSPLELDRAVQYGREALARDTDDDDEAASLHFSLANALAARAESAPSAGLLEEALDHIRCGLTLLGQDHPDYPGFTINLASALRSQALQQGRIEPLTEAARLVREIILPGIPHDHDDRSVASATSAAVLSEAAHWQDSEELHREAISLYEEAIDTARPGTDERVNALINLASATRDASDFLSDDQLLQRGIEAGEEAVEAVCAPGLRRARALTVTSNLLRDRFVRHGRLRDLDEARSLAEEALHLTPRENVEYAARQTNLAVILSDEYTERADRGNLDQAVHLYREALAVDEREPHRVVERRNDLALALRDRHKDSREISDLDEAVMQSRRAVQDTDASLIAWKGYANNYANALAERFEITGNLDDLDEAAAYFRAIQVDTTERRIEASGYACNLGLVMASSAFHRLNTQDLDEALEHLRRSISLLPDGHPDTAYRLSNLADVYRQRAVVGFPEDDPGQAIVWVQKARLAAEKAVSLAGDSGPRLLPALAIQARILRQMLELAPDTVDIQEVLAVQRRAATLRDISASERFGQCVLWAQDARDAQDDLQELEAHDQAVRLTSEVAWVGLTADERLTLLNTMSETLIRAVGHALAVGEHWKALAWADQIRSVLARQDSMFNLYAQRTDATTTFTPSLFRTTDLQGSNSQGARERRRTLAHAAAEDLQLQTPDPGSYAALRFPGFLVLLVPGDARSSALLVDGHDGSCKEVALPEAGRGELSEVVETFREACEDLRGGESFSFHQELRARHALFDTFGWLWKAVVQPVLASLPEASNRPRVWWSPVGEFALLPLHAAGEHPRTAAMIESLSDPRLACVGDRARSSYLPVVWPPSTERGFDNRQLRLLYVGPELSRANLPQAGAELRAVREALGTDAITELVDDSATVEAIRREIPVHSLLHVSAHGHAGDGGALSTGFRTAGGIFTLRDLSECRTECGQLALFVSCDSAIGDFASPNEALHLAGSAQMSGYPDVVAATMPLRDSGTTSFVAPFYRAIAGASEPIGGLVPDLLSDLVNGLRLSAKTGADPLTWAPYAHFGWGLAASPSTADAALTH